MRLRASSSAAFVGALLVKDTFAAVHRGHQALHAKRDVVVDDVIETITVTSYVTVEWPPATVEPTTTSTSTTTQTVSRKTRIASSSSSVTTPVSSAPPAAVVVAPVAEVNVAAAVPTTTLATIAIPATTSAVAVVVSSTPAAVATGSSSGSKRGAAYNNAALVSAFTGSKVSWAYDWDSSPQGLSTAFEFVPLLWGTGADFVNKWAAKAQAAIDSGSSHLLAFNEPDHPQQANIGVGECVSGYKAHMMPFAGKAKLGSPAVTNGGAPMGLDYLKRFVDACTGCTIDFVVVHWYDAASNVEYFKKHVSDAYTAGGNRPVWITEFGAAGSSAEQVAFLQIVLPWLDSLAYVERYAYFMASDGVLLSGSSLSTLGHTFAST